MSFSQSLHSELTLRTNFLELLQFHLCLQTSHVCLLQGPRRPHKPSLIFSECIFFNLLVEYSQKLYFVYYLVLKKVDSRHYISSFGKK